MKVQKNRMLSNTTKSTIYTHHLRDDVKNVLDQLIKSGHLERLGTVEEDSFVSPVVITVRKDKSIKIAHMSEN